MKITESVKKYRHIVTIVLAMVGIGIMAYYDYCNTTCSYLKGDIFGIDLKWVGSAYMVAIILFAAFKQTPFVRAMLAAGLGVEVHLYAFQVQNNVYCPFCLAFSIMLILSFIINYEVPSAWRENRHRMWLYFLGEVNFPMFKINKLPLLFFSVLGYLSVLLTFSGSVTPAYGQDSARLIPSLGKGKYEIVMFTDYFCPPCRKIDTKAEPLFKKLIATGLVKITFIDVPFSQTTPMYAKYYLYAVNSGVNDKELLRIRASLFSAAQVNNIQKENVMLDYLSQQMIAWKPYDEKPVFQQLSIVIKENDVNRTPTCVVKYSPKDVKKYVGDDEIWNGLTQLKTHLRTLKK